MQFDDERVGDFEGEILSIEEIPIRCQRCPCRLRECITDTGVTFVCPVHGPNWKAVD